MRQLSRVFLMLVLLLMVAIPVSAKPATEAHYNSAYADTDVGYVALGVWDQPWGMNEYVDVGVWTDSDYWYCYNMGPSFDVDELLQFSHGHGVMELAVEFPISECDYFYGEVPDVVSFDLILTAGTVYHETSHRNIVRGPGEKQNCQRWAGYDVAATGSIAGHPVTNTFWGDMVNETCR